MGGRLSVDECTSTDNQRVRDCCHLEGETPIEIRIAYQQPRPPQRLAGFTHTGGALAPGSGLGATNGVSNLGSLPASGGGTRIGTFTGGYENAPLSGRSWPTARGDAEKPAMPRGAERLRLPPPGANPWSNSARQGHVDGDDFDPDTFAAPPDSERGEGSVASARNQMQQALALKVLQMQQEEDHFPEIIRARITHRDGSSSTRGGSSQRTFSSGMRSSREGSGANSGGSPPSKSMSSALNEDFQRPAPLPRDAFGSGNGDGASASDSAANNESRI
mmetsp:Transcript_14169/g.38945  ORF Transcript_14169/g.38945 Transcript_14169/m.38945 type:complete len:276 (-) Transcript_14169:112-939(-)